MTWRTVASFAAWACAAIITQGISVAEDPETEEPPKAKLVVAQTNQTPSLLLWKVDGRPTERTRLTELTDSLAVGAGEGCLVAVREGSAPLVRLMTLEPDEVHFLDPMEWRPGVSVTGLVADPSEVPLVARLALAQPATRAAEQDLCTLAQREGGITQGVTDESGAFVLGPVAPGTYTLAATADKHESVERKLVMGPNPTIRDVGTVVLEEVAELELSFDFSRLEEEPPFALAFYRQVEGWFGEQAAEWPEARNIALADDAPLQFKLKPGTYRLAFSKESTDVRFVQEATLSPGFNAIRLRPWPITVYGKVSKSDEPVEDANVLFICSGSETEVTTSEEGEYEARLWTAALCGVRAHAPEGGGYATSVDLRTAEFGDEEELDLEIPDNVVAGTVVEASTKKPIAGALVAISQIQSDRSGQTNSRTSANDEGEFEFNSVLGDSPRTVLYADADDYLPTKKEIEVTGGEPTVVQLELEEATGIRGRVLGPGGEPVSGAVVGCCALNPRDRFPVSTKTDAQGEFSLDGPPGTVVFGSAVGYSLGWANALEPDEQTTIHLGPRAQPVLLRLLDSDSVPVAGVFPFYSTASAGVLARGLLETDALMNQQSPRTDEDGYLWTASLPPGLYQVLVFTAGGPTVVGVVSVPFSGEATLHLPTE